MLLVHTSPVPPRLKKSQRTNPHRTYIYFSTRRYVSHYSVSPTPGLPSFIQTLFFSGGPGGGRKNNVNESKLSPFWTEIGCFGKGFRLLFDELMRKKGRHFSTKGAPDVLLTISYGVDIFSNPPPPTFFFKMGADFKYQRKSSGVESYQETRRGIEGGVV